ncbi:hypothetical protein V8E53_006827 [Lactarius tabidus]
MDVFSCKVKLTFLLVGTAMTVTLVIAPMSLIPMAIYFKFPFGQCYVNLNSVLAMLNSRGYVRDRGSPDNSDLTSIQVAPPSEALGYKSKPTDISVIVRRSTALVDAQNESDPNMGHAFEVPKLVRWLLFLATRSIII